jgi:hypothetical protein
MVKKIVERYFVNVFDKASSVHYKFRGVSHLIIDDASFQFTNARLIAMLDRYQVIPQPLSPDATEEQSDQKPGRPL